MSKALYGVISGKARKAKKQYGVVREFSYSDKNLLPQFAQAVTNRGITITPLKDGGLHITGSVTDGSSMIVIQNPFDGSALAGTMYTFSVRTDTPETSGGLQVRFLNASGGVVGASNMAVDTQLRYTNVSSGYITTVTKFAVRLGSGITYDHVIYVQLEEGSEATEFEPHEIWQNLTHKITTSYDVVDGKTKMFYKNVQGIGAAVITLASGTLTYNGSTQTKQVASVVLDGKTLVAGTDYTVSGNTGTNAGNYTLTVTGIGDYEGTATKAWSIAKATGSISVSPTSLSVKGAKGSTATATIIYTGDGAISVASNKTSVATVSRTGNIVTVTSVATGSATITITMAAGTNYTGASCTISVAVDTAIFGSYSGDYTTSTATIDGTVHTLYSLTGSGTLVLNDTAKVWMCGGGSGGRKASYYYHDNGSTYECGGGGGAGGYVGGGELTEGTYVITVGSGGNSNGTGGTTSIANGDTNVFEILGGKNVSKNLSGCSGGTGGGGGGNIVGLGSGGTGAGVSTYPFGLSSLKAHCGGGGGGGTRTVSKNIGDGANGGTNGGDGSSAIMISGTDSTGHGGAGGAYGGGTGGLAGKGHSSNTGYTYDGEVGGNATFYGSGGGGGSACGDGDTNLYAGGKGYQGVVYVAVPV